MGRRDFPDAERIAKRAKKLRDGAGSQATLDNKSVDLYTQAHIIPVQEKDDKAIGSGIVGGMVDRRANIEGARPEGLVLALGGDAAEQHASGKLEPWLNTAVWLAQGDFDVWDAGVQLQQCIGETAGVVLPAPQFHGGTEYKELVDEWNRRIDAEEDTKEIKEKMRVYRRDHFPIAWRAVNPKSAFIDWDDEGRAEVYYFRKLSRNTIEERFPGTELEDNKEDFEVIETANDVWVSTVFPEGSGFAGIGKRPAKFLGEPWKHEMGCNPYYFIRRSPLMENTQGYTRTGCAFQALHMIESVDESMTFWQGAMRREGKTPIVTTLIPAIRRLLGIEDKKIEPDKKGNITLYASKDEGKEEVGRAPAPTVNEQHPYLIGLLMSHIDRSGASVPQMMGEGPSGSSAVRQSIDRQSAITGELEVPHRHLQEGFAAVCERVFRCVIALDKMLPEDADDDMRKVVVRAGVTRHKSREITVTAADVRNYELMVRGKIKQNMPVDEGANVTNALLVTNNEGGKTPLVDRNTAREHHLGIENPQDIDDKVQEQAIVDDYLMVYREGLRDRAKLAVDELTDAEWAKLAEEMQDMSPQAQAALVSELGGEAEGGMVGDLARGQANTARTARGQRMTRLGSMGVRPEQVQ